MFTDKHPVVYQLAVTSSVPINGSCGIDSLTEVVEAIGDQLSLQLSLLSGDILECTSLLTANSCVPGDTHSTIHVNYDIFVSVTDQGSESPTLLPVTSLFSFYGLQIHLPLQTSLMVVLLSCM